MTEHVPSRHVLSADGVSLAVYETGEPGRPTVVAVHGYPDDHTVWDGVVALLAADFHVVTYDVRGAGASAAPQQREGYRIPHLVDDLLAVVDATAPGEDVHLIGHDWGSVQSWGAVVDERLEQRLLSFTSISGPSLDYASAWLRGIRRHPGAALRQLAESSYIGFFQLPVVPEAAIRAGLLDRLLAWSSGVQAPRSQRDAVNGLELYRANFLNRMASPEPRSTVVPVQVIAPSRDPYISTRLACEAPEPYVPDLRTHVVDGGHWIVSRKPDVVVDLFRAFAADVTR
ncbi:alpha/beta fold hydrolase [Nocardioides sp. CER19]|uniref:alpha/beta fold hydrolase n=1 Tax=Nocardioides sp. CER19 TaxID=3038538 RepID=UPI00244CCABE|nr:alpha/beta fold hydrolase [Nocardioides sp. CER19]MDH2412761.1 alpha/beta fold hydrolase [Nocardioides sp. CER19]